MPVITRKMPEFPEEVQKELWDIRREYCMLSGFKFFEAVEESLIRNLSMEDAAKTVAETKEALEAFRASQKKKGRKPAKKIPSDAGNSPADSPQNEPNDGNGGTPSEPSEPSSESSDDDDDPRRNISKRDKEKIRGRSPRVTLGRSSKLFKADPPARYSSSTDAERSYDAVKLFLSQLSRYLRLSTHVDMEDDISEYVTFFLDGFAYKWFETLDKGDKPFLWKDFEEVFRKKFIPREHIQQALNKYLAVKQDGRPVIEYIVEKEEYENTLGDIIRGPLKETSFREGLDGWLRGRLMVFRELPFKEYKDKAEVVDQEAKALKIGPYKPKNTEKRTNPSTSNSKQNQNSSKPKSNKDRDKPSKDQLKKEGKCYECLEKGHLAKDCPKKKKEKKEKEKDSKSTPESLETSAIRLTNPMISSKKDGRTYREVVSGQPESPKVPTISVVEKPEVTEKKPPPMTAMIPINGVPSKCLIDTGSSDDFLATHFATVNRISVRKRATPLSIQQAVKGSKPKTNAVASVNVQFGEWTKTLKAHVAGLAGYDAILGIPTLTDGDAVVDVKARKVHLRAWDVTLDCEIVEESQKPQKKHPRMLNSRKMTAKVNGILTMKGKVGNYKNFKIPKNGKQPRELSLSSPN